MEAAAVGVAARGVGLQVSSSSSSSSSSASQPSRKQWRVVSEQSGRNSGSEELERAKMGQSDERLIYEVQQGREPADVDFCSITINGSLDNNVLQQRLHTVVKQREELQQMEVELRAQLIARTEIIQMQNTFNAQIKEHGNANAKLQEQLHEREQKMLELERKMEEKERELHAIRLDNEAAWAKEDLLREQSKELQNYRRERDNSEAERVQHIKQIHDLQEHIQEKERQFMELQEQNRIAQETILFKDEQLREAQAWISRVQEMDVLQSSTNQSLQAELRDRTEHYNHLWLGYQRQFGETERLHLHIQKLQLDLAEAKERTGTHSEGSHAAQTNSKDISHIGENNGGQVDVSGKITPNGNASGLSNENAENTSVISAGNASTQTDQVHGVPLAPSSLLGMAGYIPPGQVTALHPFVMHQQGVPHSVPPHIPQHHIGQFHSVSVMSALQQWQNQQAPTESSQIPAHSQYSPETAATLLRSESNYNYETPVNGQDIHPVFLNVNISQDVQPNTVVSSTKEEREVFDSIDKNYLPGTQSQQHIQSQFHTSLRLDPLEHNNNDKMAQEKNVNHLANHGLGAQGLVTEQPSSTPNSWQSEVANHTLNFSSQTLNASPVKVLPEAYASSGQKSPHAVGKPAELPLLDERSLLACIVRTIPPVFGGRIRISSTLPNRLAKMLAPLHWHDYKKKYGKLDEFVASHPELFVIDEDYIQLREGAQETLAATAAFAKVAAAAAAATSHSPLLPSVALTPMAQSNRLKKVLSIESTSTKTDNPSQLLEMHSRRLNGAFFNVAGGSSNVKILSKPKDCVELNGSEFRPNQSILMTVGNGSNSDRNDLGALQSKASANGRPVAHFAGKPQGRAFGAAASSRR